MRPCGPANVADSAGSQPPGAPVVYCLALSTLCLGFGLLVFAPFSPAALTGFLLLCGFATVGFAAILTILAQRFEPTEQAARLHLQPLTSTAPWATLHIYIPLHLQPLGPRSTSTAPYIYSPLGPIVTSPV